MSPTRPALRWHGGKWRLAQHILPHFPPHKVYVEPFGGAGSVLLRKPPAAADVYNDLDGELVNLFRVLRDKGMAAELRSLLRLTPYSRAEMLAAYETPPPPQSQMVERARRLAIRSWMVHGGDACKVNRWPTFRCISLKDTRSKFAREWVSWQQSLDAIVERMQGVTVESRDAFQLIHKLDGRQVLFYMDPPYVAGTRSARRQVHYSVELSDADHVRLARLLRQLQGMVVLSGYHSSLYDRLYKGWKVVELAAVGEKATRRTEVLWINAAAQSAMREQVQGSRSARLQRVATRTPGPAARS